MVYYIKAQTHKEPYKSSHQQISYSSSHDESQPTIPRRRRPEENRVFLKKSTY